MPTAAPTSIDIDRVASVALVWPDGLEHRFDLPELRTNCPCAECRGRRDRGEAAWSPSATPLSIVSAEPVGAWGLSLIWSDGHATGIYSWDLLRDWTLAAHGIG